VRPALSGKEREGDTKIGTRGGVRFLLAEKGKKTHATFIKGRKREENNCHLERRKKCGRR